MTEPGRVLLLTVGTGTATQLEETLLRPFAKSIREGQWARVVLFPSKATEGNARQLSGAHTQIQIEVRALRRPGEEENIDACFSYFDVEIARLRGLGFAPTHMTADLTRGTKAMSAALALAAAAHGIRTIRYVGATERDERGMARPGKETVSDVNPGTVWERNLLSRGIDFLRAGDFRAAGALFPGSPSIQFPGPRRTEIRWLGWLATFWGAWDHFHYQEARKAGEAQNMPKEVPAWASAFLPTDDQLEFLGRLAKPEPRKRPDQADACRDLTADLFGNAERRLAQGQTEECLVRLYRVLELIGQTRLFTHGLDSSRLNISHPVVGCWLAKAKNPLSPNRDGAYPAGREQVASLLQELRDSFAARLVDLTWLGEFGPTMRNKSILIHGFRARTTGRRDDLKALQAKLQSFYAEESPANGSRLRCGQFGFLTL